MPCSFHSGTKNEQGKRVFALHLEGIVVDGRYTLHFDLSEPDATFLPVLTLYFTAPVCRSAGFKYSREWRACGAGPFRLENWQPSRDISLVRHQGYFEPGLPNLAASIATFVLISFSFAVYLPSNHENWYSNGNLIPPTSR